MNQPPSGHSYLCKRQSDADENLRVRAAAPVSFSGQAQSASGSQTPLVTRNPLELRAFGLEDRADAVISSSSTNWSLNNLAQWRQEMTQQTQTSSTTEAKSKAYIAQRQREFKQQMLRARQPASQ